MTIFVLILIFGDFVMSLYRAQQENATESRETDRRTHRERETVCVCVCNVCVCGCVSLCWGHSFRHGGRWGDGGGGSSLQRQAADHPRDNLQTQKNRQKSKTRPLPNLNCSRGARLGTNTYSWNVISRSCAMSRRYSPSELLVRSTSTYGGLVLIWKYSKNVLKTRGKAPSIYRRFRMARTNGDPKCEL